MSSFSLLKPVQVENNLNQGCYRPKFFELQAFNLNRIEFNNYLYQGEDIERILLLGKFSFAYLREDKLRTIDAYSSSGEKISFNDFLKHFTLSIKSSNIYKTGKYLSRVFRPVKYGAFFKDLNVYVNRNSQTLKKNTDGISLISLELARSLGWKDVQENSSAQFTLLYANGMVKGNWL